MVFPEKILTVTVLRYSKYANSLMKKQLKLLHVRTVVNILYNVCAMILTFVRLGVISFTSLRQKCHKKIKAKCQKYLVKVSQMTRVPQVKYHCCNIFKSHLISRPFLLKKSNCKVRVSYKGKS